MEETDPSDQENSESEKDKNMFLMSLKHTFEDIVNHAFNKNDQIRGDLFDLVFS